MQPGHRLAGRYELEEPLDRSPGGVLWRALDTALGREVAVRISTPAVADDPDAARRFRTRATAAAGLEHRHAVTVYDVAAEDGRPYVVTELAEGVSLRQLLTGGALSPGAVATIGRDVADALAAAHARGLVHGDLTTANVLVAPTGEAKLADLAELTGAAAAGDDVRDLRRLLRRGLSPADPDGLPADLPAPLARATADGDGQDPARLAAGLDDLVDEGTRAELADLVRSRAPAAPTVATPSRGGDETRAMAVPPAGGDGEPTSVIERPERGDGDTSTLTPGDRGDRQAPAGSGSRRGRRLLIGVVSVAAVVAGAALLAGVLGEGGGPAADPGAATGAAAVQITDAADFDPAGDGSEHADEVPRAVDGDPATVWTTEHYASPALGGLKSGVGLWVRLSRPTDPSRITLRLPTGGVDLQVHLADQPPQGADPSAWGTRLGTARDASGEVTVEAPGGETGRVVVVWFTSLAPADGRYQAQLAELSVSG